VFFSIYTSKQDTKKRMIVAAAQDVMLKTRHSKWVGWQWFLG